MSEYPTWRSALGFVQASLNPGCSIWASSSAGGSSAPTVSRVAETLCVCGCGETTGGSFAPGHDRRMVEEVRRGVRNIVELIPYPKLYQLAENGHGPAEPVLGQSDPERLARVLAQRAQRQAERG